MKKTNIGPLLCVLLSFTSLSIIAQESSNMQDKIVGKWILQSATYNDLLVSSPVKNGFTFYFSNDGKVVLLKYNGQKQKGDYLIDGDKLIDPNAPEYLDATIVHLSDQRLVISMQEDQDRVVLEFAAVADLKHQLEDNITKIKK